MTPILVTPPTDVELIARIRAHLARRTDESVALVWRGYLAALLEWGLISVSRHDALAHMLPEAGADIVAEVFLGFADDGEGTS